MDEIMRRMQGSDEKVQAVRTRALPVWLDLVSPRLLASTLVTTEGRGFPNNQGKGCTRVLNKYGS